MSTMYWLGQADAVAQVTTATPGGTIGTETFTLTVGGAAVSHTASPGDGATQVAEGLRDAWNASTHPYHTGVTATAATGVVTLTADVPGVPFVVTTSATGSATLTLAAVVGSSGPHHWDAAGNWSGGAVPVSGDTVVIRRSGVSILWGLDQSSVVLAELRIEQSYTGRIGLADEALAVDCETVDGGKAEYRTAALRIGATLLGVGEGDGAGSDRLRLDTGSASTSVLIAGSAAGGGGGGADDGLPPIQWSGQHASNVLTVLAGRVGIAVNQPGQAATVATLRVARTAEGVDPAEVSIGAGVTLDEVDQAGGTIDSRASITTLHQMAGELVLQGGAALGSATVAGVLRVRSSGGVSSLTVLPTGVADLSEDPRPRTVAACALHPGATLRLDSGHTSDITFSTGIDLVQCQPGDCTIRTDPGLTLTLS